MERLYPQLSVSGSGRGATMEPIWQLLRSTTNTAEWNPEFRGSLKSAFANRQYTQTRVMSAGWADHNRCLTCLSNIVDAESSAQHNGDCKKRGVRNPVVATAEQIEKAPIGNSTTEFGKEPALHQ